MNDKVLDTSGAGDWTSAALINVLFKEKRSAESFLQADLVAALNEEQPVGARSCSFEGARGMMQYF